ncbi:MFS transporter [Pseudalkalibacillus berkeleyi]|uniref:MFS transporter n=1 Tax=Pseudalkalibacillus berkeleyi TaxID=1069813 RepID=A0ABS9H2W7_9BACL|nr:MFS transporter [Pseudalkalibacillus berkeleyi]MCF6138451.1 MFS transporter [Pseudalkalibacillus berkeleyi]
MIKKVEIPTISIIGLLALSIIFGWFRYGYGLLLPKFKEDFNLSASILGVISSLTFLSFLIGALTVILVVSRLGARPVILGGIFAASAGLLLSGLTNNSLIFALGCTIAGLSPGLTWSSFSESVNQNVRNGIQNRALAIISTGSTLGLIMISSLYLLVNGDWRLIWVSGGIIGFIIFIWAFKSIPFPKQDESFQKEVLKVNVRPLLTKRSKPLYISSILFGITEATYWTYSADFVQENLFISHANAIFFLVTGIGGLVGLWAGDFINKLGFKVCFIITILLYSFSISILFISQNWLLVCVSGFLFGSSFMLYAAFLPIWSAQVFPNIPAIGFSISIILLNIGAIIGPALFGVILSHVKYETIFLVAGLIGCLKVFVLPVTRQATNM